MRIRKDFRPVTKEDLDMLLERAQELTERIYNAPEPLFRSDAQREELEADEEELQLVNRLLDEYREVIFNRTMAQVIPFMNRMRAEAEKGTNPQLVKDYNELKEGYEIILRDWVARYRSMQ